MRRVTRQQAQQEALADGVQDEGKLEPPQDPRRIQEALQVHVHVNSGDGRGSRSRGGHRGRRGRGGRQTNRERALPEEVNGGVL
jgi:hypothetical protein